MSLLRSQPSGLPVGPRDGDVTGHSPKFTVIKLNDHLRMVQGGTNLPSLLRPLGPTGLPPWPSEGGRGVPPYLLGRESFSCRGARGEARVIPLRGPGVRPRGLRQDRGLGAGTGILVPARH